MLEHLHDLAALEAAIDESHLRPVLLFKHSATCGISHEAFDALHALIERGVPAAAYRVITVQSHRHISDEAAARLGIRHETPQAILLRGGKPVWKASHFRITTDALATALS